MRKCREASSTAALSFSPPVPQRSADSVERHWASRLAAESFSEPSATAPASAECARSPFSVLKVQSEEDALNRTTGVTQLAALAAGKSLWMKYPRRQTAGRRKQAERRFHEPAIGSGPSRAVSRFAGAGSVEAEPVIGCEPSLFLAAQVPPLGLGKLIRNRRVVTSQSCSLLKWDSR